jgi:ribosome-binding protein aMBF1 (putative translation factor)
MTQRKNTRRVARSRRDDLETFIQERTESDPGFPGLMAEAAERKRLLSELADARRSAGLTQTVVAARMGTSTSAVARLEHGEINATLSTVQRFAAAIGKTVRWQLSDRSASRR